MLFRGFPSAVRRGTGRPRRHGRHAAESQDGAARPGLRIAHPPVRNHNVHVHALRALRPVAQLGDRGGPTNHQYLRGNIVDIPHRGDDTHWPDGGYRGLDVHILVLARRSPGCHVRVTSQHRVRMPHHPVADDFARLSHGRHVVHEREPLEFFGVCGGLVCLARLRGDVQHHQPDRGLPGQGMRMGARGIHLHHQHAVCVDRLVQQ